MGQQQLLLLVLTVVIVGLATASGIDAFGENQRKARQDQTVVQLMSLITQAQAWKMKPVALGGGHNGDDNDFLAFSLDQIGVTRTGMQGSREIYRANDYACFKVFTNANYFQINALNVDCDNGSVWMTIRATGIRLDDISFIWGGANNVRNNGQ